MLQTAAKLLSQLGRKNCPVKFGKQIFDVMQITIQQQLFCPLQLFVSVKMMSKLCSEESLPKF